MNTVKWDEIISRLDYAFQPIVNIHSGVCFGYEALLRNCDRAGFQAIHQVFDRAFQENTLSYVELRLREKAIQRYVQLPHAPKTHLFFNLDNRILELPEIGGGETAELLSRFNLPSGVLTLEVSERHQASSTPNQRAVLNSYKAQGVKLAIDDFGTGFSGLQLLYCADPDFIKIDRFFISDIASDSKKKLFVSQILNICHVLGILVIAEGVESEREFYCCREIGCDFVQGYLVQRPTLNLAELKPEYHEVAALAQRDRRRTRSDQLIVGTQIEPLPSLKIDDEMSAVFEIFRRNRDSTFFPVVNSLNEPLGIVREQDIKGYVYSQYGKELLQRKARPYRLADFLTKCPLADTNTGAERILEIFSLGNTADGILMVKDTKYAGFLSTRSLLKIVHEKRLAQAYDLNPLSRLPGNYAVYEYLSRSLADKLNAYTIVYYDFDNFKPFNDTYGFRNGDRAILLFTELLKKELPHENSFLGHIGGDDFFSGYRGTGPSEVAKQTLALIGRFKQDVECFYNAADRQRGYLVSKDRKGQMQQFPLLTVSAAVLHLPEGEARLTPEEATRIIAELKKAAKSSPHNIAIFSAGWCPTPCDSKTPVKVNVSEALAGQAACFTELADEDGLSAQEAELSANAVEPA